METVQLLSTLFDDKTVKVVKGLLLKKGVFFLRDLSRESGVSLATTYRIVQKLKQMGLVVKEQRDKIEYYRVVKDSEIYEQLYVLLFGKRQEPIDVLMSAVRDKYGSSTSIFVPNKNKNKVFIVGEDIPTQSINEICARVKEETGQRFEALVVSPFQFQQMKSMGLIGDGKNI